MDFVILVQLALATLTALVGFPSLLSVVIAVLEHFSWLSPKKVNVFNFWANAVVFIGIFVAALLGKFDLINQLDSGLGVAAKWLIQVLILLGIPYGFAGARRLHGHLRQGLLER